jgi:hypothetical protein
MYHIKRSKGTLASLSGISEVEVRMSIQPISTHRLQLLAIIILTVCLAWPGSATAIPRLPAVILDTTYIAPTGRTISVPAGGDLQAAINNAQPGDTISLQAGATFTGNYSLPNKGGSQWIVIRTSTPDSGLPPPGTRVSPSQANLMPKIVTTNDAPAISTDAAANHYRFIGIEITTTHTDTAWTVWTLVRVEYPGQSSYSQVPSDIIFDRCYIHGTPTGNVRIGVDLNSARSAVIDSYISDIHEIGQDAVGILGFNGPGPFKIVNNYIESAAENVMFGGGGTPTIANLVPSDIEVRNNYMSKPLKWRVGDPSYAGIHWSIKNVFELKMAQRVLVENNILENSWEDSQNGFAVLFTVRNQDGGANWAIVQDVTFQNNIIRHAGSGLVVLGRDYNYPSQQLQHVVIQNNLFDDVSGARWGGNGWMFELHENPDDIIINHNTAFTDGNIIMADGPATTNFVYTNNLSPNNQYGVTGTGTGTGIPTLNYYFPGAVFDKNLLAGGTVSDYPPDNFFPSSLNNVGFMNLSGGDYRLSSTSPYKNAGTDGADIGADIAGLLAATANVVKGVMSGSTSTPPPPPPPSGGGTTAPVISAVSAPLVSSSQATITWSTNVPSDSQVEYGTTTAYGSSSTLNSGMVVSHSQPLSGLNSQTTYHYRVKSKDSSGNLATSADTTFVTPPGVDVIPPTVSITSPASGATVKGKIKVVATASDNVGVVGVRFQLDGVNITTEDTSAPYTITWNTSRASNGRHALTAVARDKAGNTAISTAVVVTVTGGTGTVDTTAPSISNVTASSLTSTAATISWNTMEASDSQVEYGATTSYGNSVALDPNLMTSHVQGVNGLNANTLYHYRVKSKDVAGNLSVSGDFTFSTASPTTPFSGTPASVPGVIQAENFDLGGEGKAYHDATPGNSGGSYRTDVDVDIVPGAGGYVINDFQTGEWLKYTINVTQAGTYMLEANVSSEVTTSQFHIEIDGVNVSNSILVPNTGNWQNFQFVGAGTIPLTAGIHLLTVVSEQQYFNFDALRISVPSNGGSTATRQNVVWTNLVGVAATGNSIQMTTCDACPAGATSQQQIISGDGYVEFTGSELSRRTIGLSNGNPGTTADEINYSFGLWPNGGLDIRENGMYKAESTYTTGDILRIAVVNGVVNFYKNGNFIYSSSMPVTYPLLVDSAMFTPLSTLTNVVISGAQ